MSNKSKAIVPVVGGEIVDASELVRGQVRKALASSPGLISFDESSDEGQLLALRCAVDPGVPAQARDGWRGVVRGWWVGVYDVTEEQTGEVVTLPSLVLMSVEGELCRLTGWPAINSWASIVVHMSTSMRERGIPVRVYRRASGTGGRSYWQVLPDVCPSAPGS